MKNKSILVAVLLIVATLVALAGTTSANPQPAQEIISACTRGMFHGSGYITSDGTSTVTGIRTRFLSEVSQGNQLNFFKGERIVLNVISDTQIIVNAPVEAYSDQMFYVVSCARYRAYLPFVSR